VISGYERGVNEICALLGFYAASIGNFLPSFRDNSWWWWDSHSSAGEDSSQMGRFAVHLHLQSQQSKMKAVSSALTLH